MSKAPPKTSDSAIRHPHVVWRDGRPRFSPGPGLRAAGHVGCDLRHEDGTWFSRGECVDFADRLRRDLVRTRARDKARGIVGNAYTVQRMVSDWYSSPRFTLEPPQGYRPATAIDFRQKLRVIEDDHPLIWNAPARDVERTHLRAMFEEIWTGRARTRSRPALAPRGLATARSVILVLSSCYAWALLRGKVKRAENPCYRLKMPKPAPRVRFGTRTEIEALVAGADLLGRPDWGDMVLLGVWTGQRQGDRVELRHKGLLAGRRHFRQAKTGALVAVLQAPQLEARLKASIERRRAARAEALLAATGDAERARIEDRFAHVVLDEARWLPYSGDHWSRSYLQLRTAVAAGIPGDEPGTWRLAPVQSVATLWDLDMRDTAVTWMALAGATIAEICAVTGHELETATQVLKHYLARHPEMADEALRKMIAWYDAGGETEFGL